MSNGEKTCQNPKLERFEAFITSLNTQCAEYFSMNQDTNFTKKPLEQIVFHLESNIIQDTYESLTIEGYKVNRTDISYIHTLESEKETRKVSSKIDIRGYLDAYNIVAEKIKSNFGNSPKINDDLLFDINLTLFSHSPIAKKYTIPREYRKNNIRITGTSYLPPEYILVDEYMERFTQFINGLEGSSPMEVYKKAILAHFLFTYIHPFGDGNGRTGRLLMNYILAVHGYAPITVPANKRDPYIESLKEASEKNDIIPFVKFITHLM